MPAVPAGRRVRNHITSVTTDHAHERPSVRRTAHDYVIGAAVEMDADLARLTGIESAVIPGSRLRVARLRTLPHGDVRSPRADPDHFDDLALIGRVDLRFHGEDVVEAIRRVTQDARAD